MSEVGTKQADGHEALLINPSEVPQADRVASKVRFAFAAESGSRTKPFLFCLLSGFIYRQPQRSA